MFTIIYLISIIISYLIFRLYFIYGINVQYSPVGLSIFVIFIPCMNIAIPLTLLLIDLSSKMKPLDYKKIFFIKTK